MMTVCYSHESAPGASPAQSLDSTADFPGLDCPQGHLSLEDFSLQQPRFVFPAAPPSPDASPKTCSSRRRRPFSAIETHTRSLSLAIETADRIPRRAALPDFTFNPGANLAPAPDVQLLLSPPPELSSGTTKSTLSPPRPGGHGHRRGGSEFVGGRLREGSSIAVFNANVTSSENAPPISLQLPPPGRRGHRRGVSGTISTADLPIIPMPIRNPFHEETIAPHNLGIAPQNTSPPLSPGDSPVIRLEEPADFLEPNYIANTEITRDFAVAAEDFTERKQKSDKSPVRARVGFSDVLEFIPRPLSLISNDTSSTVTARPRHSFSGSISSIMSGAPSGRESPTPLCRVPTSEAVESRLSTGSAFLNDVAEPHSQDESMLTERRNSIPILAVVSDADVLVDTRQSPTKTPRRWSFFGFDSLTSSGSPSRMRSNSSSSSDSTPRATCSESSDHGSDVSVDGDEDQSKPKKSGKKGSKKNRVKGWAGSILPRKSKVKKQLKAVRPPTPPASASHLEDDDDDEDLHAPVSKKPEMSFPTVKIPERNSFFSGRVADETCSPMIDLDAALGPFNTPPSFNAEWEAAQNINDHSSMRRLHSAQGLRGFNGPGMHYHRRSESAPALPPFDSGRLFINRFGSTSTMADVFEEDEEYEDGNGGQSKRKADDDLDSKTSHLRVPSTDMDLLAVDPQDKPQKIARRWSSTLSDRDPFGTPTVRAECSRTSLKEVVIAEEPTVAFPAWMSHSSRNSFESGSPILRPLDGPHDLSLADDTPLSLSNLSSVPIGSYTMSSSYPSPRSPMSIEAQRISTAASSITDANSFHSLLMGEPGPEVRISLDYDIPSLTSSNSIMTRESTPNPLSQANHPLPRDQRPVSVSAAFGRRRSSLVSLSRLISSSHGERSKLSTEVTVHDLASQEKKPKTKTRRLSRLMQFWKPNKADTTA